MCSMTIRRNPEAIARSQAEDVHTYVEEALKENVGVLGAQAPYGQKQE